MLPARPPRHRHRARPHHEPAPTSGDRSRHGHGHGRAELADRRVRRLIVALLVPAAVATLAGLLVLHPTPDSLHPSGGAAALPRVAGHVSAAAEAACGQDVDGDGCYAVTVDLAGGPLAGRSIVTPVSAVHGGAPYRPGDDVVLVSSGDDPTDPHTYQIVDFQRDAPLGLLALVFGLAVVALGGWRGAAALVGLAITGAVLLAFILPAILSGKDPLAVAVVGSCAIMFVVLYLTHGVSARTSAAVLGTLASLLLIGLLGAGFAAAARITGSDEDTAALASVLGFGIDGRGLVLAGLVIGALGALDDVTVTQASAVWELRHADPDRGALALFRAAMRIGRDHVGATVNTLVLAYAGAALPLLLLFSVAGRTLGDVLTTQVIATELVRGLVGSIGLVAAVPLTTALAVAISRPSPRTRAWPGGTRTDPSSGMTTAQASTNPVFANATADCPPSRAAGPHVPGAQRERRAVRHHHRRHRAELAQLDPTGHRPLRRPPAIFGAVHRAP